MCGIAGVKRFGNSPITLDEIRVLLASLEHRGTDATGIALMAGNQIDVHKNDDAAWRYITSKGFTTFIEEKLTDQVDTVILHTRASTCGNPRENKNNHPLTLGGAAIVHNGMIGNHIDVFKELKVERSAETDSDAIRAVVDVYGITMDAIKAMRKLEGSIAAACIDPRYPGKLMLLRSGSPLTMAHVGDKLMWASEKSAIHRAARPWGMVRNFWVQTEEVPVQWCATPVDTAMIIGPEGLEVHAEFKTCRYYTTPDYTKQRRDYSSRQARWDRDLNSKDVATFIQRVDRGVNVSYYLCRNPQCTAHNFIVEKIKHLPLTKVSCHKCGWSLEKDTTKVEAATV